MMPLIRPPERTTSRSQKSGVVVGSGVGVAVGVAVGGVVGSGVSVRPQAESTNAARRMAALNVI